MEIPSVGAVPWRGVGKGLLVMSISSISSTQSLPLSGVIASWPTHHKKGLYESTASALTAATGPSATSTNELASAVAAALMQLGLTPAPATAATAASAAVTTPIAAASATDGSFRSADATGMTAGSSSVSNASQGLPAFFAQVLAAAQQTAETGAASPLATTAPTSVNNAAATSTAPFASLPRQLQGPQQVQQYTNVASTVSSLGQALSSFSSNASSRAGGASSLTTVFQNLWASLGASSGTSAGVSSSAIPSLPSFLQTLARNFSESGISGLRGVFVDTVV
jgi:hypothetical protein